MVQEQQLQLKMTFLLGYNLKVFIQWWKGGINFQWVRNKNLVGKEAGGIFPGGGNERIFGWWGWRTSPVPPPSRENPGLVIGHQLQIILWMLRISLDGYLYRNLLSYNFYFYNVKRLRILNDRFSEVFPKSHVAISYR